jgi:hypothetical protein
MTRRRPVGTGLWSPATSAGVWAAPVSLVLVTVQVLQNSAYWAHEWAWALDNWAGAAQIVAPLFGGAACWDAAAVLRRGRADWLASSRRGAVALVAAVLPALLLALTVLTAGAAWVVIACLRTGAAGPIPWQPVASALLAVSAAVLVGAAAGRLLPHPATSGVVAVALWGLAVGESAALGVGGLFGVGGATTTLAGLRFVDGVVVARVVGLLLVVVLALALLTPRRWRLWSAPRLAVAATAVLLLLGGVVTGRFATTDDLRADPAVRASECRGTAPVVCVAPEHAYRLDVARAELAELERALRQIDPALGTDRYAETLPGQRTPATGRAYSLLLDDAPGETAASTLLSRDCRTSLDSFSPERLEAFDAGYMVATHWVHDTVAPGRLDPGLRTEMRARLGTDPAAESRWLAATLRALRDCRLGDVAPPPGA